MSRFSQCFLLVFGQLAVGGLAALAVPPFATLERGFFKSTASVYLGCAVAFLVGRVTLVVRAGGLGAGDVVEIGLWTLFTAALVAYLVALWGEDAARRARTYPLALALGLVALVASAMEFRLGPLVGPSTVLTPLAFVTAALALGGVATGMSLGHWYLIDVGLSIEPLMRVYRYFVRVLVAHLAVLGATLAALAVVPGPGADAVHLLFRDHGPLLATRLLLGPVAALGIGWLIHRTLKIPQTMAATGLFYIAILAVLVGEFLGRLILFRTSLPL